MLQYILNIQLYCKVKDHAEVFIFYVAGAGTAI